MRILLASLAALALACGTTQQQQNAPVDCNGQTCSGNEVCVVTTAGGGACILPDDAGVCPNGSHSTGCCDNTTTTYACAALPDSCGGSLSCPCAESLCQCGGCGVADAGVLSCECLYP